MRFEPRGPVREHTQAATFCCVSADAIVIDSAALADIPQQRHHTLAVPISNMRNMSQRALLDGAAQLHPPRGAFTFRELRISAARRPDGLGAEPCRMMAYAAVPKQKRVDLTIRPIAQRPSDTSGVSALPPMRLSVRSPVSDT